MPGFAADHPRYLVADTDVETVYRMLLEVASELWVTRDRLLLLEGTLTRRGLMSAAELEELAFDDTQAALLEEERQRFVGRLFGCVEDVPATDGR
ncbi:hypothetical protein [Rhodococcus sp. 5G237]